MQILCQLFSTMCPKAGNCHFPFKFPLIPFNFGTLCPEQYGAMCALEPFSVFLNRAKFWIGPRLLVKFPNFTAFPSPHQCMFILPCESLNFVGIYICKLAVSAFAFPHWLRINLLFTLWPPNLCVWSTYKRHFWHFLSLRKYPLAPFFARRIAKESPLQN